MPSILKLRHYQRVSNNVPFGFQHLSPTIIPCDAIHTFKGGQSRGCAILSLMPKLDFRSNVLRTIFDPLLDALRFIRVKLRPRNALAAENLFLRDLQTFAFSSAGKCARSIVTRTASPGEGKPGSRYAPCLLGLLRVLPNVPL